MQMIDDIAGLVADQGRALTIKKNTYGAYAPSTSSATVSAANVSALGFLLDYNAKERDGERIKSGDRKAVIQAKSLASAPVMGDLIDDGSVSGQIINIRIIEQRGVTIAYICQVRY